MKSLVRSVAILGALALAAPAWAQDKDKAAAKVSPDDKEIDRKLDNQKINLNLDETPLAEAFDLVHDLTGITVVVGPLAKDLIDSESLKASVKVQGLSVRNALDRVLAVKKDLRYEVWRGCVFVTTKGDKEKPEPTLGKLEEKLDAKRATVDFNETPLKDVVAFLADLGVAKLQVSKEIDQEQVKISLAMKNARVSDVLAVLARMTGLKVEEKDGSLTLGPR